MKKSKFVRQGLKKYRNGGQVDPEPKPKYSKEQAKPNAVGLKLPSSYPQEVHPWGKDFSLSRVEEQIAPPDKVGVKISKQLPAYGDKTWHQMYIEWLKETQRGKYVDTGETQNITREVQKGEKVYGESDDSGKKERLKPGTVVYDKSLLESPELYKYQQDTKHRYYPNPSKKDAGEYKRMIPAKNFNAPELEYQQMLKEGIDMAEAVKRLEKAKEELKKATAYTHRSNAEPENMKAGFLAQSKVDAIEMYIKERKSEEEEINARIDASRGKRRYAQGGSLESQYGQAGSAIGSVAGTALQALGIPGLSGVLSTLGNVVGSKIGAPIDMQNQMNQLTVNKNPYGFAFGGALTGRADAGVYKGRLHTNGGILVNSKGIPSGKPDAEVEGGELAVTIGGKSYIFSNRIKV